MKNRSPLALAFLFSLPLALYGSAAAQYNDPSLAPEGSTVYVEVDVGTGRVLRDIGGRKCPTAHVPVPIDGKLICKRQDQPSERVKQMKIQAQLAGPGDAARMHMMSDRASKAGKNYMYGQDPLSPLVVTVNCPTGTTAMVTNYPAEGDRICVGNEPRFKKGSEPRIYEPTNNAYKPFRATKACPGGAQPVAGNFPFQGDLFCPTENMPAPNFMANGFPSNLEKPLNLTTAASILNEPAAAAPVVTQKPQDAPVPKEDAAETKPATERKTDWWAGGWAMLNEDPGKWFGCTFNPFSWGSDECSGKKTAAAQTASAPSGSSDIKEASLVPSNALADAHAKARNSSPVTPEEEKAKKVVCPGGMSGYWHSASKSWRCPRKESVHAGGRTHTVNADGIGAINVKVEDGRPNCKSTHLALRSGICVKKAAYYRITSNSRVTIIGKTGCDKKQKKIPSDEYSYEKVTLCK